MTKRIEKYRVKGYEVLNHFVGEYVLMYRFNDGSKVRLYFDGRDIGGY